jgi:hypothetical protein
MSFGLYSGRGWIPGQARDDMKRAQDDISEGPG